MKGQNIRNYFIRKIQYHTKNTTSFCFYSFKRLSIENKERENQTVLIFINYL